MSSPSVVSSPPGRKKTGSVVSLVGLSTLTLSQDDDQRLQKAQRERDNFAGELDRMRVEFETFRRDASQASVYLERQLEESKSAYKLLQAQHNNLEDEFVLTQQRATDEQNSALDAYKVRAQGEIADLQAKNARLSAAVQELEVFKAQKASLFANLDEYKSALSTQEQAHRHEKQRLEQAFLEARDRLRQESAAQLYKSRTVFKKEALSNLDTQSLDIRRENERLLSELSFQEHTSDTLQTQNDDLRKKIKVMAREIDLLQGKDEENAKKSIRQQRIIQELNDKLKSAEKALATNMSNTVYARASMIEDHTAVVSQVQSERDAALRTLQIKAAELKKVKGLAKTIIRQRNDVEMFFHEALDTVRAQIVQKQATEYKDAKKTYTKHLLDKAKPRSKRTLLPSVSPSPRSAAEQQQQQQRKASSVQLRDMSLEDREKVLRLLFAKINNMGSTKRRVEPHTFDDHRPAAIEDSDSDARGVTPMIESAHPSDYYESASDKGATFLTD